MMPDRLIRDELLNSERYWSGSDEAKLLYIHLILSADDTARYSGKNFTLRTRCFSGRGMETNRMEILLTELVDEDLIRLYFVEDERFIFIPRFKQRLRYYNSKYPDPPIQINDIHYKKTDSSLTQAKLKTDSSLLKRSEEKRSEEKLNTILVESKIPPCPHQEIISIYHNTLPELPKVLSWNKTREGYLKQRWRQLFVEFECKSAEEGLDWFKNDFFQFVRDSKFLMGKVQSKDRNTFLADLEWMIKPTNFTKIIERKYEN
jgi:hypothetical protein